MELINTSIFNTVPTPNADALDCAFETHALLTLNNNILALSEALSELNDIITIRNEHKDDTAFFDTYVEAIVETNIGQVFVSNEGSPVDLLINRAIKIIKKLLHHIKMLVIKFSRFIGKKLGLIKNKKVMVKEGSILVTRSSMQAAIQSLGNSTSTIELNKVIDSRLVLSITTCNNLLMDTSDASIVIPVNAPIKNIKSVHVVNCDAVVNLVQQQLGGLLTYSELTDDIELIIKTMASISVSSANILSHSKHEFDQLRKDLNQDISATKFNTAKLIDLVNEDKYSKFIVDVKDLQKIQKGILDINHSISLLEKKVTHELTLHDITKQIPNTAELHIETDKSHLIKTLMDELTEMSNLVNKVCINATTFLESCRILNGISI